MDRLEMIRMKVDQMIQALADENDRKFAYIHLYGTSQFASMLAIKRRADVTVAATAAMLHDIASYACNVSEADHAKRSAEIAQEMLTDSKLFQEDEIKLIMHAISVHSDKQTKDDNVYAEILKDADVMSHYFYNPKIEISDKERVRLYYLLEMLEKKDVVPQINN